MTIKWTNAYCVLLVLLCLPWRTESTSAKSKALFNSNIVPGIIASALGGVTDDTNKKSSISGKCLVKIKKQFLELKFYRNIKPVASTGGLNNK